MPAQFFEDFPKIEYPFTGKIIDREGNKKFVTSITATDLMLRYRIRQDVLKNPLSYYSYLWQDTDRPDIVAHKYYGSSNFAWLVMFSGELFHWLYDLPMPHREFIDYIESKYDKDWFETQNDVHHYEDADGHIIDKDTYDSLIESERSIVFVYDFEQTLNEGRRDVKLLSKKYLPQIQEELADTLKAIKDGRKVTATPFIQK